MYSKYQLGIFMLFFQNSAIPGTSQEPPGGGTGQYGRLSFTLYMVTPPILLSEPGFATHEHYFS